MTADICIHAIHLDHSAVHNSRWIMPMMIMIEMTVMIVMMLLIADDENDADDDDDND